jgi:hypothetical protein
MEGAYTLTGNLVFDAKQVRDLVEWANALGRCLELTKAEGIALICPGVCPRAFALGCDPERDPFWAESAAILWPWEDDDRVVVDPELLEPHLHAGAKWVLIQAIFTHDQQFSGICGVRVEPPA